MRHRLYAAAMPDLSPPSDESRGLSFDLPYLRATEHARPKQLEYAVVDVFTERVFAGNPLAVVFGAERLSDSQMRAVAIEFNLSETTFPVPLTPQDQAEGGDYRLRIFTPGGEVPFAGHPTLGTAWLLARNGLLEPGLRRQACGAGLIDVVVPEDVTAPVELTASARDAARVLDPSQTAEVAALVGLEVDEIIGPAYVAGCGLSWVYLRVAASALALARPTGRKVSETSIDTSVLTDPLDGVDVYAVDAPKVAATAGQRPSSDPEVSGDEPLRVRSRVFVPGYGISEDPATGSAAAGLGLVLVATGQAVADGWTSYRIIQGEEMGRPSVLHGRVEAANGAAVRSRVAGHVVLAARGLMRVPPPS